MVVDAFVSFGKMTGRNQDAIKKTTSGLLKIIYPHRTTETLRIEELKACLEIAVESRQRILDQLSVISPGGEYKGVNLSEQIKIRENIQN